MESFGEGSPLFLFMDEFGQHHKYAEVGKIVELSDVGCEARLSRNSGRKPDETTCKRMESEGDSKLLADVVNEQPSKQLESGYSEEASRLKRQAVEEDAYNETKSIHFEGGPNWESIDTDPSGSTMEWKKLDDPVVVEKCKLEARDTKFKEMVKEKDSPELETNRSISGEKPPEVSDEIVNLLQGQMNRGSNQTTNLKPEADPGSCEALKKYVDKAVDKDSLCNLAKNTKASRLSVNSSSSKQSEASTASRFDSKASKNLSKGSLKIPSASKKLFLSELEYDSADDVTTSESQAALEEIMSATYEEIHASTTSKKDVTKERKIYPEAVINPCLFRRGSADGKGRSESGKDPDSEGVSHNEVEERDSIGVARSSPIHTSALPKPLTPAGNARTIRESVKRTETSSATSRIKEKAKICTPKEANPANKEMLAIQKGRGTLLKSKASKKDKPQNQPGTIALKPRVIEAKAASTIPRLVKGRSGNEKPANASESRSKPQSANVKEKCSQSSNCSGTGSKCSSNLSAGSFSQELTERIDRFSEKLKTTLHIHDLKETSDSPKRPSQGGNKLNQIRYNAASGLQHRRLDPNRVEAEETVTIFEGPMKGETMEDQTGKEQDSIAFGKRVNRTFAKSKIPAAVRVPEKQKEKPLAKVQGFKKRPVFRKGLTVRPETAQTAQEKAPLPSGESGNIAADSDNNRKDEPGGKEEEIIKVDAVKPLSSVDSSSSTLRKEPELRSIQGAEEVKVQVRLPDFWIDVHEDAFLKGTSIGMKVADMARAAKEELRREFWKHGLEERPKKRTEKSHEILDIGVSVMEKVLGEADNQESQVQNPAVHDAFQNYMDSRSAEWNGGQWFL